MGKTDEIRIDSQNYIKMKVCKHKNYIEIMSYFATDESMWDVLFSYLLKYRTEAAINIIFIKTWNMNKMYKDKWAESGFRTGSVPWQWRWEY